MVSHFLPPTYAFINRPLLSVWR